MKIMGTEEQKLREIVILLADALEAISLAKPSASSDNARDLIVAALRIAGYTQLQAERASLQSWTGL